MIPCGAALIVACMPLAGRAQVAQPAACTYAACALRLQPGLLGARLVRGAASDDIGGRLGSFGSGIDPLLAGPDSAAVHAHQYVDATRRSSTLGLLGAGVYAVGLTVASSSRGSQRDVATATTAVLGGALFVGRSAVCPEGPGAPRSRGMVVQRRVGALVLQPGGNNRHLHASFTSNRMEP